MWHTLNEADDWTSFGFNLSAGDQYLDPLGGPGNVVPIQGFLDYGNVHCNGDMFSWDGCNFDVTPHEIAEIIRNHIIWGGENIRLLACSAGAYPDGAAYELAMDLGVQVYAPVDLLHINDETGEMYVLGCTRAELTKLIEDKDYRTTAEYQQEQWRLLP